MNVTLAQLVLAVSIPTAVAMIGLLFSVIFNNRLADKIDRQTENFNNQVATLNAKIDRQSESLNNKIDRQIENFNNQVTVLLSTIHNVDIRVVKLEEKDK